MSWFEYGTPEKRHWRKGVALRVRNLTPELLAYVNRYKGRLQQIFYVLWAFTIQTHLPPPEAQALYESFFEEYWYEVDQPYRLTGILVNLEYMIDS